MADLARTITLGSQRLTVLPRIPDTARRVIDHHAKEVTNSDATQAYAGPRSPVVVAAGKVHRRAHASLIPAAPVREALTL